jgi:hypothetical protein
MVNLEERLLLSSLKQPLSWFRFIDDVDMKWTHGDKELDELLEHANSIHIPSSWGMFVYMEVTSMVTSVVFSGMVKFSIFLK